MAASDKFYQDVIKEINPLFNEFGKEFTVSKPGSYDEDAMVTLPSVTRKVWGIVAEQELTSGIMQMANGSFTKWTGSSNLILRNDANLQPEETITVDGKEYPASKVEQVKPADIVVIFIMELTR